MMWHPLLWLPDRLATRYTLVDDNGACSTEPDDIWCLRVCLELQAAGLYDPDTGSWLDVLSLAGLDGDDPDTAGRVDRWLTGGADPVLDRLDLTEHVDRPDDLDWALHAAIDELPAMRVVSWVLTAQDLLDACDALRTGGDDVSPGSAGPPAPSPCSRKRILRPFPATEGPGLSAANSRSTTSPMRKACGGRVSGAGCSSSPATRTP